MGGDGERWDCRIGRNEWRFLEKFLKEANGSRRWFEEVPRWLEEEFGEARELGRSGETVWLVLEELEEKVLAEEVGVWEKETIFGIRR
jgi:hypothetical protein